MKERVIVYLQTREKDRYKGKNSNIILLEERVGEEVNMLFFIFKCDYVN